MPRKKHSRNTLSDKFCRCIKAVRTTVRLRKSAAKGTKKAANTAKESAAIAICVRSVLGARGKTLSKFSCKDKKLVTKKL